MKKIHIMMVLSLAALVGACDNGSTSVELNTIIESELTEREEALVLTVSNQGLVYDFNIDNNYNEATLWIEKYEFGELVEENLGQVSMEISEDGFIIITRYNSIVNQYETRNFFNISISSGGGTGTLRTSDAIADSETENAAMTWENTASNGIDISNDEIVLASFIHSFSDEGLNSLSPEFYEDIEGNSHEIGDYEVVYIFKAEFTERDPDYLD